MSNQCKTAVWRCCVSSIVAGLAMSTAHVEAQTGKVQFPTNPAAWFNSPPLSTEMFAGKSVALYFFRQTSITGALDAPRIIAESRNHVDKPVIFIAVVSGYPRTYVEDYLEEVPIPWPLIVDADSTISRACGLMQRPSLMVRIIKPDGSIVRGDWDNMDATVATAMQGASWRVDAKLVPEDMKPTWRQVEFGAYAAALPGIKKHLFSPKPDHKTCAEKLMAAVEKEIADRWTAAKDAISLDKKWDALKILGPMPAQFKGYKLPPDALAALKQLPADPTVRSEQAALKQLDLARPAFLSDNAGQKKSGKSLLEKLIGAYPNTEAAGIAQTLLTGDGTM